MDYELRTALARVDAIRKQPDLRDELVELLGERSAVYDGLAAKEADRLRGYILASFEATGMPAAAMPFVIEELESGIEPYAVAGAARALRGFADVPSGIRQLLVSAADRIISTNEYVDHNCFETSCASANTLTAHAEVLLTINTIDQASMRISKHCCSSMPPERVEEPTLSQSSFSDCCGAAPALSNPLQVFGAIARSESIPSINVQDQNGLVSNNHEFFLGRVSIVAFFYTRCMNPNKCSLTITKLGFLQNFLKNMSIENDVNIAAFTYDPDYDLPERLYRYGCDRGMVFGERSKLLRTIDSFDVIRNFFELGVSFGQITVNHHRLELFILDRVGFIREAFLRTQWDEISVVDTLRKHM